MASKIPELNDREWLFEQYVKEGRTDQDIADELMCATTTVWAWRRRYGISARKQDGPAALTCTHCGKSFERYASAVAMNKHRFCNRDCKRAWQTEHQSGENNPFWKGGLITCRCAYCEASLMRTPSRAGKFEHHFCNAKCLGAWASIYRTAANNPNWKGGPTDERGKWLRNGGREFNTACRKRDVYTCQRCGRVFSKHSSGLAVHHKAAFAKHVELRSELPNGISLCRRCHLWVHSNEGALVYYRWEQEALSELAEFLDAEESEVAACSN